MHQHLQVVVAAGKIDSKTIRDVAEINKPLRLQKPVFG